MRYSMLGSVRFSRSGSGRSAQAPALDGHGPGLRAELSAGALEVKKERSWDRTVADVSELLT